MKHFKVLMPCFLALLTPAVALAGDCGNLALAAFYGFGGPWNNRPVVVNNFTPPYFSLHPPVYYGNRFYRPYGESPFASWPQLQPNPAYSPQVSSAIARAEATIRNPHYVPDIPAAPSSAPKSTPKGSHSAPTENVIPPADQPNGDNPVQPAKVPDVVKRGTGPITIDNPYFREPNKYISK